MKDSCPRTYYNSVGPFHQKVFRKKFQFWKFDCSLQSVRLNILTGEFYFNLQQSVRIIQHFRRVLFLVAVESSSSRIKIKWNESFLRSNYKKKKKNTFKRKIPVGERIRPFYQNSEKSPALRIWFLTGDRSLSTN